MPTAAAEKTTEIVAEIPRRKPAPALPKNAIKLSESVNNSWRAVAPRGTTRERLLNSDFWAVVSADFLPYDRIIVVAEDRSYYCELLVIDAGRGYCQCEELSFKTLAPLIIANNDIPPNHEIIHLGPDEMYGVRRLSDGIMLGKNFGSREEALAFLLDHATLR